MGEAVAECQGPLERGTAEVEVTVFRAEVLTAVGSLLDGERRGDGLVEDVDGLHLDLHVAGGHLRVLAFAFEDFAGHLDHEFTSEFGCGGDEFRSRIGLHHELGDAIAVAEVDEGHTSEFAGFLNPSREGHFLTFVGDAEFAAGVRSVHIFCSLQSISQRY